MCRSHSGTRELPRQAGSDAPHPGGLFANWAGSGGGLRDDSRIGKQES